MTTAPRIFSAEYYERMRLLESDSWCNAGMRGVAERLLRRVDLPSRGTLLDIGCGSRQTMTWFLEGHPDWKAAGIDIALEGVTAARSLRLDVVHGDAMRLPFKSGSADLMICLDVLQHLPLADGDSRSRNEIIRVLRSRGSVFIRTTASRFRAQPTIPTTIVASTFQLF